MSSDPDAPFPDRDPDDGEADDPRRDPMAPPPVPCECWCLHCGRTFMSDQIWFQRVIGDPDGFPGFWMCPTPNCGGAGFTFDIFPTDPDHPANEGWHYCDDEEGDEEEGEWDPDEAKYQEMDGEYGDDMDVDDDDLEGEEWKFGLQPGERPAPSPADEEARRAWEQEQLQYDQPDERPRELDWSDRPSRRQAFPPPSDEQQFREDDIPF